MTPRDRLYGGTLQDRLAALRELVAGGAGETPRRAVNLHIHTNESFSSFRSPTEAVWQAVEEHIAVLGINDHYTVAGHEEFRRACEIAGIPATFSMEAVAMDREAERAGLRLNDPGNPGRTYLSAKGITRYPREDEKAAESLAGLRKALDARHREMTAKLGEVFAARLERPGPSWEDVLALTPAGNATERHIARAAYEYLAGDVGGIAKLCAARPKESDAANSTALQNFIRAKLLKAGASCFVPESPEAFLSLEQMREMFLGFGAIPTYPALLNPATDLEADPAALLERLEGLGFFALEVIPFRNTRERLAALVDAARARHWPVFTGSEHNTPEPKPLTDAYTLDPEFEPWFAQSARVLLGHQAERAAGRPGFVGPDGRPSIADARERFEHFREAADRPSTT